MMTGVVVLVFGGSLLVAGYAIAATVTANVDRIVAALRGEPQQRFEPLASLVRAERHIAIRRWAATPAPRPRPLRYEAA